MVNELKCDLKLMRRKVIFRLILTINTNTDIVFNNFNIKIEDPRLVRLNLFGTEFIALRETLVRCEWFRKLLEEEDNPIKYKGAYFIERLPMTFQYVLNYLSNGKLLFFEALDRAQKIQFLSDAAFYSLLPVDQHLKGN